MSDTPVPGSRPADGRCLPVDHLRAFITLLVVLHHAVLAYHQYGPGVPKDWTAPPLIWRAFPIVDPVKWSGIDLLVGFNDTFFMALMFFIGGLFVPRSLTLRGAAGYVRERALRLGVPFVLAAGVLAPLAYYPSYLQAGGTPGFAGFWQAWTSLGVWPSGPAWFLWVLLALGVIAAITYRIWPAFVPTLSRTLGALGEKPGRFFLAFAALAVLAYAPLAHVVNPMDWIAFGPFTVQGARGLLYALYFAVGIAVGAYGSERGLMARDGLLARRWMLWQAVAPILFFVFLAVVIAIFMQLEHGMPGLALLTTANVLMALTGVVTSLTFIATFARFAHWRGRVWDSLHRNAYGIFLLHYVFVAWLQYLLLGAGLPGFAKGTLVFTGAVALSWATSVALRRIAAVDRVI